MKTRILSILAALLFIIIVCSCEQKGTIRGQVVDKSTNKPIPSVRIAFLEEDTVCKTDLDGKYFAYLPPGIHGVEVSKDGYHTTKGRIGILADKERIANFRLVKYVCDSLSCNIEYKTCPECSTSGTLEGQVTDEKTGENLPIARIILLGTQYETKTESNGYFSIKNVHPEIYDIEASALGYHSRKAENIKIKKGEITILNFKLCIDVNGHPGPIVVPPFK